MGSRGLMIESRTHNRKVASSSLGPAGIVGGGSECTALSPPSISQLRCPWARHRTHNCSPGTTAKMAAHCSRCVFTVCVCSLLCVCTWMGKCRAQILSMGHHIWLYVTSLSLIGLKSSFIAISYSWLEWAYLWYIYLIVSLLIPRCDHPY